MPGISPTLEGAFSSPTPSPNPLPTALTTSTESTESARTIRGSMPPTPAAGHAVRTPSYPFPSVPNTPRWASAFHMPFTNLSPTVAAGQSREYAAPQERIASESSTPAASSTPFAPGGRHYQSPDAEDPRFPSPNLYEIVLRLGAEPGLPAWWTAVTSIMRDHYGAERATLAVPADASDIENVPWGQKTSFTATTNNGSPFAATYQEATGTHFPSEEESGSRENEHAHMPPATTIPERRPKLFSHHSFAGHERQRSNTSPDTPTPAPLTRPRGPIRAASHAPHMSARTSTKAGFPGFV